MKHSFKQFLLEDEDITAGVKALAGAFKDGYNRGKTHGEQSVTKRTAEQERQDRKNLISDIEVYIKNLFEQFPYYGGPGGPEDLLEKYQSFKSAEYMFKFFKKSSETLTNLCSDMNKALVSQKKVRNDVMNIIKTKSRSMAAEGPPQPIINFTKKESDFFVRLLNIDKDDFSIDESNFKHILSAKIRATDKARIEDAAMALNILFNYLIREFTAKARTIGEVARKRKQEEASNKE